MNARVGVIRYARSVLTAAAFAALLANCVDQPKPAEKGHPMLPDGAVSAATGINFGKMSAEFRMGRAVPFALFYADSADFAATGFGTLHGRNAIASELGGEGARLGVTEFSRGPAGHQITGRIVRDSGQYELQGMKSKLPADLAPRGHYWTVWQYTENGQWLILADTLVGDGKSHADLAPHKHVDHPPKASTKAS